MIDVMCFVGGLLTMRILGYLLNYQKMVAESEDFKSKKRGLIKREYKTGDGVEFAVEVEIYEMESSATRSKIKPIKVYFEGTQNQSFDNKIKNLLDELWVPSSDIEWINDKSHDREEKIKEILK